MNTIHSLHKKLLLRLLFVGLAVSFIFGIAVIARTWNMVGEVVSDRAVYAVEHFNFSAIRFLNDDGITDRQGLQQALEDFTRVSRDSEMGKYVFIRIYNRDIHKYYRLTLIYTVIT